MNENNCIDKHSDTESTNLTDLLTLDVTSCVKTVTDLWTLAHMTKDLEGDPVWKVLYQMGCNPVPVEKIGYNFDYKGFKGVYVPMRISSWTIRFGFPKLASRSIKSREELNELINIANSMVLESKFTLMENEVWLIFERHISENEDYSNLVRHILENLRSGAELFYKIS